MKSLPRTTPPPRTPAFALSGRKDDPVLKTEGVLQQELLALFRTSNPGNIKYYWYSLWAHTSTDLAADVPNLLVAPQFPVWFVPEWQRR
ncbi:uncharacterized protein BJ212DRAFT_1362160 [Suillus subaureus]|uniref:Uncharacterized protein n=1 Tax=Suillus subaureus TaxID=48587 RepID=A0A9P7JCT1_9AGAM|nr:uncharacterized protein BJ212DRAFT_1362160 [Suillus subaureus]KAG1814780.1 hypothetical protein BJ212DRAFT_1362160 [Suillus subaureus]